MKRLLIVLLATGLFFNAGAAEKESPQPKALKVLMIGNSFSICVLNQMPAIARSMGLELDLVSMFIGGCSLETHWKNATSEKPIAPYLITWNYGGVKNATNAPIRSVAREMMVYNWSTKKKDRPGHGANIPEMLTADKWDVVTIQQASHYSWQPATYHPWGDDLVKLIRARAPQAEIVFQETWSYTPWDKRLARFGLDRDTMYSCIRAACKDFAQKYRFRTIPTGTAVQEWRKRLPVVYTENSFGGDVAGSAKFERTADGKWEPKGDVFHLNASGDYLQGLVWTARLFGVDVRKCAYRPSNMSEKDAVLMRECAMAAIGR